MHVTVKPNFITGINLILSISLHNQRHQTCSICNEKTHTFWRHWNVTIQWFFLFVFFSFISTLKLFYDISLSATATVLMKLKLKNKKIWLHFFSGGEPRWPFAERQNFVFLWRYKKFFYILLSITLWKHSLNMYSSFTHHLCIHTMDFGIPFYNDK